MAWSYLRKVEEDAERGGVIYWTHLLMTIMRSKYILIDKCV